MPVVNYREINKKRDDMYDRYGGMMTLRQVKKELGVSDDRTAKEHLRDLGVHPTRIGRAVKYETYLLAKALVTRREITI